MDLNEGELSRLFVSLDSLRFQVTLLLNFRQASKYQAQLRGPPLKAMVWNDDTPRKLFSEDGFLMVISMPRLMGTDGTVS